MIGNIMTEEQFLTKIKKVHGNTYDYSKTIYTGSANKITITCPIHGGCEEMPIG